MSDNILHHFKGSKLDSRELSARVINELTFKNIPENIDCHPLAYLHGIAKNIVCLEYRKTGKEIPYDNQHMDSFHHPDIPVEEKDIIRERTWIFIARLPESCRKLLEEFYSTINISEIAQRLGYKNSDTAYSRKQQCIIKLTDLIEENDPWLADKIKKKKKERKKA